MCVARVQETVLWSCPNISYESISLHFVNMTGMHEHVGESHSDSSRLINLEFVQTSYNTRKIPGEAQPEQL